MQRRQGTVIERIEIADTVTIPCFDSFGNATTLHIGPPDDFEVVLVKDSGPGWVDVERDNRDEGNQ
jgi:hypothetical protein